MKVKTVAFVVLLVVMAGSIIATAASTTPISISQPMSFSVLGVGNTAVALADPVPGGGPGGDN